MLSRFVRWYVKRHPEVLLRTEVVRVGGSMLLGNVTHGTTPHPYGERLKG